MADNEPDSLVLRYLRRLDQRTERMESDLAEVKSILASQRQHGRVHGYGRSTRKCDSRDSG